VSRIHSNTARRTALFDALDIGETEVHTVDPSTYPSEYPFVVRVGDEAALELVQVNSGVGDVADPWVVTRAFGGSTEIYHSPGALVEHVFVAEDIDEVTAISLDDALLDISGLSPSNDHLLQYKSGHWTNRTPIQVKSDLGLSNVDNTADTAKPISTAVAAAINQIGYNVKNFGATGNGTTDDSGAIRAAESFAHTYGGGAVFVPVGTYKMLSTVDLHSNVSVVGVAPSGLVADAGSVLASRADNMACFTIGEGVEGVRLADLSFLGDNAFTGVTGIKMIGSASGTSSKWAHLERLRFFRMAKGVHATSTSGEWQMDQVRIDHCRMNEMGTGIHLDSMNATYWTISNTSISATTCIYAQRHGGMLTLTNTVGSGVGGGSDTFLRHAAGQPLLLIGCQAEDIDNFVTYEGTSGSENGQTTFIGCEIDAPIVNPVNHRLIFQGCRFGLPGALDLTSSTSAIVLSIGSQGATWTIPQGCQLYDLDGLIPNLPEVVHVGAAADSPSGVKIGSLTSAQAAVLDFRTSGANSQYDSRLLATGGSASVGDGTLTLVGNVVTDTSLQINGAVGFFGTTPATKPTITGSRGGNAALADLLTKLAALGLIVDGTS
jgi:pectate lyase-like protein